MTRLWDKGTLFVVYPPGIATIVPPFEKAVCPARPTVAVSRSVTRVPAGPQRFAASAAT